MDKKSTVKMTAKDLPVGKRAGNFGDSSSFARTESLGGVRPARGVSGATGLLRSHDRFRMAGPGLMPSPAVGARRGAAKYSATSA